MPFFHISTPDLEREIRAMLTELAERTHAGDCDQIDVRFLLAQSVMGGMAFAPRPDDGSADQRRYDAITLAHWLRLVPDLDSVTVVVRRYGKVCRSAVLENPALTSVSGPPPAEPR